MKLTETIFMRISKKMLSCIAVMSVIIGSGMLAGCASNDDTPAPKDPNSEKSEAPDYSDKNNWLRQPKITKAVDCFYVYPTEYSDDSKGASKFADINDKSLRELWEGVYQMQGTAYEESTNVFAPYYRQANMAALATLSPEERNKTLASTPKEDVFAALDYYFENLNDGRPFILASHSQGSAMQSFVLAEYMKAHPEYLKRMIAAYVIGYSITEDYLKQNPHLKFAEGADDTGVIISYNTEEPANEGKENIVLLPGAISINPLNWKRDETYASAEENLGGYILNEKTGKMEVVPHAADAQVDLKRGVVITKTTAMEPIPAAVFGPASYHNGDYGLYYNNIKDNVAKRIAAYKEKTTATDYSVKTNWLSLPIVTKDVDAFYVYSTVYVESSYEEGAPDYAPLNSLEMILGALGEYETNASVFEESCNVFVPWYRQAGMKYAGEVSAKTGDIDAALAGVSYTDMKAALDYYFENCNNGRPFIIAGHSQGSAMVKYILKNYFKEHPDYYKRMVAAYPIGYAITKADLEAYPYWKFATGESDTGVIISYNTEGPKNVAENAHNAVVLPGAISINPLNWKLDETYAPASENKGSLVLNQKTGAREIVDLGVDAQINLARGVIVTNTTAPVTDMPNYFGPASFHENDYSFFYNNLKENVAKRIATYQSLSK